MATSTHNFEQSIWNILRICITIIFIIGIIYQTMIFFFGKNSESAKAELRIHKNELEQELNLVRSERIEKDNMIKLMNPQEMDKDLLDELLRKNLGYVEQDEKIILFKDKND